MYVQTHFQLVRELATFLSNFSHFRDMPGFDPNRMQDAPISLEEIATALLCFGLDIWPEGSYEPEDLVRQAEG